MNYFDAVDYPNILSDYPMGDAFLKTFTGMSRDALRARAPAPCVLIRRSMRYYPFLSTVAFNGSLSLLLARIQENDDEAWMQIIHHCPQLQLDFLLEDYPTSGHV